MPKLSVIIPTLNRYNDLNNTLRCLEKQRFQDFDVWVVDQSDQKQALEVQSDRIHYITFDEKSASAARNVGIKKASGEILLFLDDDVIIENPQFLDYHLRHYRNPDIPGVAGCTLEGKQELRYQRHWMSYRKKMGWLYFPTNYGCFCLVKNGRSNNLSVRRSVCIAVGGMDEQFEKGAHREESDFCLRVSEQFGPFVFDPVARLFHIGNPSGGIRSFGPKDNGKMDHTDVKAPAPKYVKAIHHYVGSLYFMHQRIPFWNRPEFLFLSLRYFVLNKNLLIRPHLFMKSSYRFIRAWIRAFQKHLQGPKYLNI